MKSIYIFSTCHPVDLSSQGRKKRGGGRRGGKKKEGRKIVKRVPSISFSITTSYCKEEGRREGEKGKSGEREGRKRNKWPSSPPLFSRLIPFFRRERRRGREKNKGKEEEGERERNDHAPTLPHRLPIRPLRGRGEKKEGGRRVGRDDRRFHGGLNIQIVTEKGRRGEKEGGKGGGRKRSSVSR